MPEKRSRNHTFLSYTPELPNFTQDRLTTQGPLGIILKPEFEQRLKNKLAPLGVTLGPDTMVLPDIRGPQNFMVYKGGNHIGWIGLVDITDEQTADEPFSIYSLIHKGSRNNLPGTPENISSMRQVGQAVDQFAQEVNDSSSIPASSGGKYRKTSKSRKSRSRKQKKTRKH